ncbi:hypothetical protein PN471_18940, partial [Aphanizomenon sp. CS-733/32]|nr:hypothetical protein [Aphanizomenon sp. CS-733/32]
SEPLTAKVIKTGINNHNYKRVIIICNTVSQAQGLYRDLQELNYDDNYKLAHIYGAIGFFDPKLGKYVICITHNPAYKLGYLID